MISRRGFLTAGAALAGGVRLVDAASPPSSGAQSAAEEPTSYNPDNVKAWFDKTYFNLVVDYYTEVPERPYGAGFTRENLLRSLATARPGFILYYGKGHSGTTAFKSRLGTEHPKLGNDPLKLLREVTREAGVRFCINPGQDMAQTGATNLHVYDIPALAPFRAAVRCRRRPECVVLEPGRQSLATEWDQGRLRFTLPSLAIHYCVRIAGFSRGEGVR